MWVPGARVPTRRDWERLSRRWRARLDDQIALLEKLRDNLTGCIGCGCLSLRACSLLNPGDTMAEHGPGAPGLKAAAEGGR
jgi:MerR family transcriptional regulator, redox-sensitive transcriptional activator SoxR